MQESKAQDDLNRNRSLACELCKQRKVKCDRQEPCTNCVKAGAICLPSTPAPARKRRQRPNQILQERLARCERLIEQCATGSVPTQKLGSTSFAGQREGSHIEPNREGNDYPTGGQAACLINRADGGHDYVETSLWARIHQEVKNIRLFVAESTGFEDEDDQNFESDDDVGLLFGNDVSSDKSGDFHLQPVQIYTLWKLFLERVDPLYKILHTPSLQLIVAKATSGIEILPHDTQALLYAMFALTVVAITEAECLNILGYQPAYALRAFKASASLALRRSKFVLHPNMTILQALLLYPLVSHQCWDRERMWTLGGLIVRLALRMGYHRDGELLGISPFETELRRRIWWQIVRFEGRFSAMLSFSQPFLPPVWDTKVPRNVNDADLDPGQEEVVTDRNGPTEMAFVVLLNEVYKHRTLSGAVPLFEVIVPKSESTSTKSAGESISSRTARAIAYSQTSNLDGSLKDLEKKIVDVEGGSIHSAALAVRQLSTDGAKELLLPLEEQPEWDTEIRSAEDLFFKGSVVTWERTVTGHEVMRRSGFGWWMRLLFLPETLTVLLTQLCQRPVGSFADRAWQVLGKMYDLYPQLYDMDLKSTVLQAQLVTQAWKARCCDPRGSGTIANTPVFLRHLEGALSSRQPPALSLQTQHLASSALLADWNDRLAVGSPNTQLTSEHQSSFRETIYATEGSNALQGLAISPLDIYELDSLLGPYFGLS